MSSDSFFWGWRSRRLTLLIVLTAFALCTAGCAPSHPTGERVIVANEKSFNMYEFKYKECVIYEFWDGGNPAYFMRCPGQTIDGRTSHTEMRGRVSETIPGPYTSTVDSQSANAINPQPTNDAQQSAKPKGANQ